ncbi:hypothetical protein CCAX7_35240 [Capsulimonas corticalis]|uniref:Uncharacterized protein n=1 Tax=Capsulimonas corticalis TaxID=2219043 RepID=A0A402CY31_9BACT|nr:hypothetical protein CCAX7_35240 [Capsulimonas corticalis]
MGTLSLTDPEQRRADVLTRLISGSITAIRAAQLLGVTDRQIRRLRSAFESNGLLSIAHGNRGRKPARTLAPEVIDQIWELAGPGGVLADFNVCHLRDVLAQEHGVAIGRSTLQRLLQQRREPPKAAARALKPLPTRQQPGATPALPSDGMCGVPDDVPGDCHAPWFAHELLP